MWWAAPDPHVGREQAGARPVVVVSGAEFHRTVTTLVLAVPVTSTDRGWVNHVALDGAHGLERASWAMTEQVRAISCESLRRRQGLVTPECLAQIHWWIRTYLV